MRFLVISIAVHLLLGLGAAVWVVQSYTASRKLTFKGGPPSPNPSTRSMEHKVQMAKKQSTMSAPAMKRITSSGVSKVTLPDMPAMPHSASAPSKMAGASGTNPGLSAGPMGAASTQSGGGPVSMFGLREAAGGGSLRGTFYDLKQNAGRQPTDAGGPDETKDNQVYFDILKSFVDSGFNESGVKTYFTAPNPLYTTQFFIPSIGANDGPKAFGLEGIVKPRRWFICYRGKVSPTESGRYRFVGFGDDLMIVRFNGAVVLNAGTMSTSRPKGQKPYPMDTGHADVGEPVDVTAGSSYPMEVVIGERPGGAFYAWLLLQKEGAQAEKDSKASPKLPIFKLAKSTVPATDKAPAFAPDTSWSIWKAEKATPVKASGLDALKKP